MTTYRSLGAEYTLTYEEDLPEYYFCLSDIPVALGNFAMGFNFGANSVPPTDALRSIALKAQGNSYFRLFLVPGDEPENLKTVVAQAGFVQLGSLTQLFWQGKIASNLNLLEAKSPELRLQATRFIGESFFARQPQERRDFITQSSANSPHRIFYLERDSDVIAAVMLSKSEHCYGLYSLCVDEKMQGQGLGSKIVLECMAIAGNDDCVLTLQTEMKLLKWYLNLGMQENGRILVFGLRSRAF
jgi:ribosomal protein S18 acetylase RimI-like enzyme